MAPIRHLLVLTLAGVLAGCAVGAHHRGGAQSGHSGMGMGGDMQAMCEMHHKMMSGKTAVEREAMMQEQMKTMTPEQRQRMMSMHAQCR
jgi:hypothetical protein